MESCDQGNWSTAFEGCGRPASLSLSLSEVPGPLPVSVWVRIKPITPPSTGWLLPQVGLIENLIHNLILPRQPTSAAAQLPCGFFKLPVFTRLTVRVFTNTN